MGRFRLRRRWSIAGALLLIAAVGVVLSYATRWAELGHRQARSALHRNDARQYRELIRSIEAGTIAAGRVPWPRPDGPGYSVWEGSFDQFERREGDYLALWSIRGLPVIDPPREGQVGRAELLALARDRARYHETLRAKWGWAAWLPWIRVEDDPLIPPISFDGIGDSSF